MGETDISWTHRPGTKARTWNPTSGCALESEGCRNCYAMRQARRFSGPGKPFDGLINIKTGKWTGAARFNTHKLAEPLTWCGPSTVFVDSMSDLFYERFTNEQIAAVFGIMAATPHHTYQILTKRAARMREWFEWVQARQVDAPNACIGIAESTVIDSVGRVVAKIAGAYGHVAWPLPNVWLGVSVENQDAADDRIPELLTTPAAVRFLSCEPLLGDVSLFAFLDGELRNQCLPKLGARTEVPGLDWVIAGAESGPRTRECKIEWLRSLRDQCAQAEVPFFLKQAVYDAREDKYGEPFIHDQTADLPSDNRPTPFRKGYGFGNGPMIERPYLDGHQHVEFPRA